MRRLLPFILLCLAASSPAAAAQAPHIKYLTPYPDARRELVRQGFDPVRILDGYREPGDWERFPTCWDLRDQLCDIYPETYNCTGGGIAYCDMLFRRRADGRLWRITITGEEGIAPNIDLRRLRYAGDEPAKRADIEGLVVVRRDGTRQRLWYSAKPPNPDVSLLVKRAQQCAAC